MERSSIRWETVGTGGMPRFYPLPFLPPIDNVRTVCQDRTVRNVRERRKETFFNRPRLKHPKVCLQTAAGDPVVLYRAGEKSKYPGSICITDGKPYGEGRWYGRILATSGEWQLPPSWSLNDVPADVAIVVTALAAAPAETAAAHGHLTGRCCFCSRKLDDERSTQVGYGPVCAGHYQLPWG